MTKTIIAVFLILLTGASWFYLDYLNKKETLAVEELRKEMEKSHLTYVQATREREQMRSRVESDMVTDLNSCYAAAEKANFDYISHLQKPDRLKPDQISLTKADLDNAATMLESDKEKCKKTYEFRTKNVGE